MTSLTMQGARDMRKIVIVAIIAIAALLLYRLWTDDAPKSKKSRKSSPRGVLSDIVRSGRNVGQKTSDAFGSLDVDR